MLVAKYILEADFLILGVGFYILGVVIAILGLARLILDVLTLILGDKIKTLRGFMLLLGAFWGILPDLR